MNREERARTISGRQETTDATAQLWCKDQKRTFPIFRVPVDALLLNPDNRRFTADKELIEEKLGRPLDPENRPDDEQAIGAILLDSTATIRIEGDRVLRGSATKDTDGLLTDWRKRGQDQPLWIRPDGLVRNGNRRLALVKRLREDEGRDAHEWIEAVILDYDDVDESELFKMEQHEQLTDDFKIKYTDINLLLTIREAANLAEIDWADTDSVRRVAGILQDIAGGSRAQAFEQLQAIRYMDIYLEESGCTNQHQKVIGKVERFRDIGKIMARMEQAYPTNAADMLRVCFAAVRANNPHGDIRTIRRMFEKKRPIYDRLVSDVEAAEEGWETGTPTINSPDLADLPQETDDLDDSDEEEGPAIEVPNYPQAGVNRFIKNAVDAYEASTGLDLESALLQAWSRLEDLDTTRLQEGLAGDKALSIREIVAKIATWASNASDTITEQASS